MRRIEVSDLHHVFDTLSSRGFTVIGPTVRDGAIVLDTIRSVDDLPRGFEDEQAPASYRLERGEKGLYFGYAVGPVSWKKFLFPPRLALFSATKVAKGFTVHDSQNDTVRAPLAFIGVRPCELNALLIQDKIFLQGEYVDPVYKAVRENTFIITVNCTVPGGNCFCTSMGTGPAAERGFDLALTEVKDNERHYFVVKAGSVRGEDVLGGIPHQKAQESDRQAAEDMLAEAARGITKRMATDNLPHLLKENFEHPHWDDVAKRCLACTNCTMVCPTCFCSTVEDTTDLAGAQAERIRRWDSCFTMDFTRVAGGNVRPTTRARYRQWLTHKLSNWVDQFGTMGCVGCGRCVTWCPSGIDLTVEVDAIRGHGTYA